MKYTDRLKLVIVADILLMVVLAAIPAFAKKETWNNFGLYLAIVLIAGGACIAASLYTERGECRKWRRIWKDPVWQTIGYVLLAVMLIINAIWIFPEHEYFYSFLWALMMATALLRDIRYYRNAVRFGMDDLNDVNELSNKYPEARPMINRKKKNEVENDE